MESFKMFFVWIILAFFMGFMCGCADFKNADVKITDIHGEIYIATDADIYIENFNGTSASWMYDHIEIKSKAMTYEIRKKDIQEIMIVLLRKDNGK